MASKTNTKEVQPINLYKYANSELLKAYLWGFSKITLSLLLFVILIFGTLHLVISLKSQSEFKPSIYDTDDYQIVFLNNNLFYFCKLTDFNNEYLQCNDPYYLVRKREDTADGTKEDKVYIRKPSEEEVFQPEGPIYIYKANIVYVAKVGNESSVIEYINKQ